METTTRFNFEAAHHARHGRVAPHMDRIERVTQRWRDWTDRNRHDPSATVSGGAPDAVNEAIGIEQRKIHEAGRRVFTECQPAIEADLERRVAAVRETFAVFVDAARELIVLETEYRRFAGACSAPTPGDGAALVRSDVRELVEGAVNVDHDLQARAARWTTKPKQGIVARGVVNQLVLD